LKVPLDRLLQYVPEELKKEEKIVEQIMATLFVCTLLTEKYNGQQAQWGMVARKATAWITKVTKQIVGDGVNIDWNSIGKKLMRFA
jgi:hypothetical protein